MQGYQRPTRLFLESILAAAPALHTAQNSFTRNPGSTGGACVYNARVHCGLTPKDHIIIALDQLSNRPTASHAMRFECARILLSALRILSVLGVALMIILNLV